MGLTVVCHGAFGREPLCTFTLPHSSWLAGTLLLLLAVLLVGVSICMLVVALHRKKKAFEVAAKWTGLVGGKGREKRDYTFIVPFPFLCNQ